MSRLVCLGQALMASVLFFVLPRWHRKAVCFVLPIILMAIGCGSSNSRTDDVPLRRHILVVLDGLRPDYVRPSLMPTLYGFGQRGVLMNRHHAVYPTVTRVNASSISTGFRIATGATTPDFPTLHITSTRVVMTPFCRRLRA